MRRLTSIVAVATFLVMLTPAAVSAQPSVTESWLGSNESGGCGQPSGTRPPLASRSGWVPDSEEVLGPYADYYGRSIAEIRTRLVWWEVPGADGFRIQVHEEAYPAFMQVTAGLEAAATEGLTYEVRPQHTYGFAARTVGGSLRLSHHAFGIGVDINSTTNPYRSDNVLVTDMPDWWVQVWRDAGFCWGGDWQSVKDAMHFAWQGPIASGYSSIPSPNPPGSVASNHTTTLFEGPSILGVPTGAESFVFGDANRDGAPDLWRIRPEGDGVHLDVSTSSRDFGACSTIDWWAAIPGAEDLTHILADYDGDGRPDLWSIDERGTFASISITTFASGFDETLSVTTRSRPSGSDSYAVGHFDDDRLADLVVFRRSGPGVNTLVEVWPGSHDFVSRYAPITIRVNGSASARWSFDLADVDRDGDLEILGIEDGISGGDGVRVLVFGSDDGFWSPGSLTPSIDAGNASIGIVDYDGDGRRDVAAFSDEGIVTIVAGGATTGPPTRWFQAPDWECGSDEGPLGPAADFDATGDGVPDVMVFAPDEGAWTVGESTGGEFVFSSWADLEDGITWGPAVSGDFDGDGLDDVATLQTGSNVWWVGESRGDFYNYTVWADFIDENIWGSVLSGDFDGNGLEDLVGYRESTDDWWVSISDGASFFTTRWAFGQDHERSVDLVGDVDGDGRSDLLWFDALGTDWWVARSTGSTFEVTRWANYSSGTSWSAHVGGDFNGDGLFDVASLLSPTNTWFVSLSNGAGFGTSSWADFTDGVSWEKQTVGDYDGDGRSDIASVQSSNGRLWVSRSMGDRFGTSAWVLDPALLGEVSPTPADFSGDGRDDLAIRVADSWTVYRSTGSSFAAEHWGSLLD